MISWSHIRVCIKGKPGSGSATLHFFTNKFSWFRSVSRSSDADPGSLSPIRIIPSRISVPNIGHPGFRIHKEFKYFNPKNCFQALGNMIRFVIRDHDPDFLSTPDPGSRGLKSHRILDPQHCLKVLQVPGYVGQLFRAETAGEVRQLGGPGFAQQAARSGQATAS